MQDFLESEEFKVLAARDGAEAVQMHLQHKDEIAVVVLDLRLPKMDGLDAFWTMKNIQPELKALFATGLPSPELEAELDKGVIEGIIIKPYQLDKVLEKISEILQEPPVVDID